MLRYAKYLSIKDSCSSNVNQSYAKYLADDTSRIKKDSVLMIATAVLLLQIPTTTPGTHRRNPRRQSDNRHKIIISIGLLIIIAVIVPKHFISFQFEAADTQWRWHTSGMRHL